MELDDEATNSVPAAGHVAGEGPQALTIRVGANSYTVEPADAPIVVGREFPAQIQINDDRISRSHLRIELHGNQWTALDTSSNGTYLDGERQASVVIGGAATIHLGDARGIPVFFELGVTAPPAQPSIGPDPFISHGPDDADVMSEGEETDPGVVRAGAAVASRRRELEISQRSLAHDKIINAGTLIAFEKGRSWPREATRAKLESVLEWAPGTISRIRADTRDEEPGERTDVLTTTVQAPLMAEAVELALAAIKSTIDSLPGPDESDFATRIGAVLNDVRKLESLAANAARSAKGAPEVVMVLSSARRTYRDLMLRASKSPHATDGQQLYAARHRAELSVAEAANAAGVPPEVITTAEADMPLSPDAAAAVRVLLTSLNRR